MAPPRKKRRLPIISPTPIPAARHRATLGGRDQARPSELPTKEGALRSRGSFAVDASVLVPEKESPISSRRCEGRWRRTPSGGELADNEYFGRLNRRGLTVATDQSRQANSAHRAMVAAEINLPENRKGSRRHCLARGCDPRTIVNERGLGQVTRYSAIEAAVDAVIAPSRRKLRRQRRNEIGVLVVAGCEGDPSKANPQSFNAILKQKLTVPRGVIARSVDWQFLIFVKTEIALFHPYTDETENTMK